MALRFKLDPAEGDHVLEGAFAFEEGKSYCFNL